MDLKEKIIWESLRLFSLKGFLSTSINDILKGANTSKGGLYNHFKSKEDLLLAVLTEARKIWRENNLQGLEGIKSPLGKVKKLISNYKDRYLKDVRNLPGGCIFITLSVELDDQRPDLSSEIKMGWSGLKKMIRRLLDEGKKEGELKKSVNTAALTEMILAGLLGTSIIYGLEKSSRHMDRSLNTLIAYLESLSNLPVSNKGC
jgi:AcrR family transcriptional regulator